MTDLLEQDILRPLGAAERLFHLYNTANPCSFSLLVHLDRAVSSEQVQEAMTEVRLAHPLLGATVAVGDDGSLAWQRTATATPITAQPASSIEDALAAEQTQRFSNGSVYWRIRLIEGVDEATAAAYPDAASSIVLTVDHRLADGMGAVPIVRDLVAALDGREVDRHPVPQPQEHLIAAAGSTQEAAPPSPPVAESDPVAPSSIRPFDGAPPAIRVRTLSSDQTRTLVQGARSHHVTVQAVLAARAQQVLARSGRSPVRIVHPADDRRILHLPTDEAAIRLLLPPARTQAAAHDGDIWADAAVLGDLLHAQTTPAAAVAGSAGLLAAQPASPEEATAGMLAVSSLDLMLTNLGVIDFEGGTSVTCVGMIGPCMTVQIADEVIAGVTTFDGRLSLSVATHTDLADAMLEIVDGID